MSWKNGSHGRTMRLAACVVCAAATIGCARPQGVLFEAIDPPKLWPRPPETARIRLIGALSGSADLRAAVSGAEVFRTALRGPRPPINFLGPHGLAFHERGILAVADTSGATVHLLDLEARTHLRISGWGEERLVAPVGVAWVGDRLFVSDVQRGELIEFDVRGAYRGRFGGDDLHHPVGIAYLPTRNRLYVVDRSQHHVVVFRPDGTRIGTLGEYGSAPGQFNYPTHLSVRGDRLLVADSGNFRVQLLDLDGRCLKTIGQKGNGAGDFALPKGVAFDSEGHLYVVDSQFENVQIFDSEGRLLLAFGREGRDLGEFWLPTGIAIDDKDRIWIADGGNRRIQVFVYLRAS